MIDVLDRLDLDGDAILLRVSAELSTSRVAVTGVTSRAGQDAKRPQSPQDLTDNPAHNVPRSAEFAARVSQSDFSPVFGAAHSADLPAAISAPSLALAPGTTASRPFSASHLPTEGRWGWGTPPAPRRRPSRSTRRSSTEPRRPR